MKKISRLLAILFAVFFVFQGSLTALADNEPEWQDVNNWTAQDFDFVLSQNVNNQAAPLTSGLIVTFAIAVSGRGSNLLIAGNTICDPDVIKCGFKVVTIERRKSTSVPWSTYKTYNDLYSNASSHTLTKTIAVPTGYLYRVTCTHYAKKSIFSTQKINNTSNTVAIL